MHIWNIYGAIFGPLNISSIFDPNICTVGCVGNHSVYLFRDGVFFLFREAVSSSLSCVRLQSFTLKEKQEEALFHLYSGQDVFAWFPTG